MEQQVRFATAPDGTRLAYAIHGKGEPFVRAAHWLTHVQYDWESPIWRPLLTDLGKRFTVVRYDERGCGLSDWDIEEFSLDAWVQDLETIVDAAGLDRFTLFGMSQGAPVAISYAVRHPDRVSGLVICGGYLHGFDGRQHTDLERQQHEAMLTLMRIGWGQDNPTFRRLYTFAFVPDGDEALLRSYDELMRRTTSARNAARFEEAFARLDVADVARQVRVPTVVMHLADDQVISFREGQLVAAAIPAAEFVQLEGRNHLMRPQDPAWRRILEVTERFVSAHRSTPGAAVGHLPADEPLSRRELEVLGLVARGLSNQEIAAELGLSVRTVERHLSNVYGKLALTGKAARAAAAARITLSREPTRGL